MTQAASASDMQSVHPVEQPTTGRVVHQLDAERPSGPSRYIDAGTQQLGMLAASWQDFMQLRKSADQRELPKAVVEAMDLAEKRLSSELSKALRKHALWPWLSQFPGLGGVHTARVISRIGDPRRFPGQQCQLGHTTRPELSAGDPCPFTDWEDNACPSTMLAPRSSTGTRSVWHYLGLHVVNGKSPRKTKGQRADWDPIGRTAVLQPDGIADHIVRQRVPIYRDIYDHTKERLSRERAVSGGADERSSGPLPIDEAADVLLVTDVSPGSRAEVVSADEIGSEDGLRPFQIEAISKKVAAKAFVADLLQEWKRLTE